ncbi:hypothetical protein EDD85DRAFT_995771 [Armillaria nabsnona]|nr:hypothetical protein EDD85DRAFT_995771 [Armillaria nabsnona]
MQPPEKLRSVAVPSGTEPACRPTPPCQCLQAPALWNTETITTCYHIPVFQWIGLWSTFNDIRDVIVDKISRRFDHVKADVRVGHNSILREATAELKKMQVESMQHYNILLDFKSEYSSYTQNVSNGLEDLHKVNLQITRHIEEILQIHDSQFELVPFDRQCDLIQTFRKTLSNTAKQGR